MSPSPSSVPAPGAPNRAACAPDGLADERIYSWRLQDRFRSRIRVIARPADCDTATVRGAAQYGLARRPLVSSVIAPQSYMLKVGRSDAADLSCPRHIWTRLTHVQVKLPAEREDWLKRPAYIRENDAGVAICENRRVRPRCRARYY